MAKLLTVVVPVYNTEEYLPKCLDSLIVEGFMECLEVLIVIDGSPDRSLEIAQDYAERHPDTFVVINKENGGHGSTINKGLELARGKYLKILDSDDWFDVDAFKLFLKKLGALDVDIAMTNYAFEYAVDGTATLQSAGGVKYDLVLSFADADHRLFPKNFGALAISAYRTQMLISKGIKLPEKKLYGDTYLQLEACIHAETFVFINVFLYRYYIGREGQSVSHDSWLRNYRDFMDALALGNRDYKANKFRPLWQQSLFIKKSIQAYTSTLYGLYINEEYEKAKAYYMDLDRFIKNEDIPVKLVIRVLYRGLPFWLFKWSYPIILRLYPLLKSLMNAK